MPSPTSQILLLVVLILLSGFFSASETALTTISASKVAELVNKKKKGSKYLKKIKENSHKLLISILIGNNIVNISASAIAGLMFTEIFSSAGIGIATAVMTFFILIFGEITPKSIAFRHAASFALSISWFYYFFGIILSPLIWFFDGIVKIFLKLVGEEPRLTVTEDEIKEMIKIGAQEGSINKQEREFIENVLQFNDIIVEDVMIHRTEIEAMPESFTLEEAADYAVAHSHSRLPVYGANLDDIRGLVSIKEILNFLENHDEKTKLSELKLSVPLDVAPTRRINSLFREFQKKRVHLAIVVDEHGGTAGLVTLEDVLEEIVGDIWDESDEAVEWVEKLDGKTVIAMGEARVEDVLEAIDVKLHDNMLESLSTVVLERLNRFPRQGEVINFPEAEIKVMRMIGKKIARLRITRKHNIDRQED